MERVKTGINGLDTIIQGGFPKNSITLVSGPPGGGKSIFCFQFIYEGAQKQEKCLFLTLDKKIEGLLVQAEELGFDFNPYIENGTVKFIFLNINKKLVYESMTNEILSGGYDRIVLDSITPLSEMPIYVSNTDSNKGFNFIGSEELPEEGSYPVKRVHLRYIMNALETSKSTSIVTSELPKGSNQLSRDGISEFLADGVITLSIDPTMDRRKMAIAKMRNTKHTLKPHDMEIGQGGIRIV
jgi:KaiC/GvpD/RAD55 family RecA-like ATPase